MLSLLISLLTKQFLLPKEQIIYACAVFLLFFPHQSNKFDFDAMTEGNRSTDKSRQERQMKSAEKASIFEIQPVYGHL